MAEQLLLENDAVTRAVSLQLTLRDEWNVGYIDCFTLYYCFLD